MPSLIETLETQGIPFVVGGDHHHVRPGWIGVDCPWCGSVGKFHLGIHVEGSMYANCWQCGHHSAAAVLMELLQVPYQSAQKLVGTTSSTSAQPKARGKLKLPKGIGPLQPPHQQYLQSRGFDPEQIATLWQVQGIGIAARLAWSLFIPILSGGEMQSWTTRSIGDRWRYHTAAATQERISAKELLYGEDYIRTAAIIVEGPTDVWRIGPGAVATLGLAYSQAQVQRILRIPIRAVCFDNSLKAQTTAKKLVSLLQLFPGETYLIQLDSEDPGEATHKEIRQIRKAILGD